MLGDEVNLLDALIVLAAAGAAVVGYRLGFLTRVISWLFLAVGFTAASALVPVVARAARGSRPGGDLVLISVGLLAAGAFLGQAVGLAVGSRLHRTLPAGPARTLDSAVGSVVGALGILLVVWLVTPAMADLAGWPARAARGSHIARSVESLFPGAPDSAQALRRLAGDRYPQVFDALRQAPDLGTPPQSSGLSLAAEQRVALSTVKVVGQACDQVQEGSGFVASDGLVITNAHVVAGERRTQVERFDDGRQLPATVVAFDSRRDVAVLKVPNLARPALPLVDAPAGTRGAVFGHPAGGPLSVRPFVIADRQNVIGTDIYNQSRTEREVLFLSSTLHPGDSGGAVVDSVGDVVGVAFAIAPDRPGVAYALTPSEVRPVLASASASAVSAGSCIQ